LKRFLLSLENGDTVMRATRRLAVLLGTVGFLAGIALLATTCVRAQVRVALQPLPPGVQPPGVPPTLNEASDQFSAVKLVENADFRRLIEAARDCIKDKDWDEAATALNEVLDKEEDFYVKVKSPGGGDAFRWASVKYEANNLLSSMPAEGLAQYELRFGGKAAQMLQEAKSTGNWELLAKLAGRYLHTDAGKQANELLATYLLDRGQYFIAALRYDHMLASLGPPFGRSAAPINGNGNGSIADLTLFKAALAYRRAGDTEKADAAWDQLEPRLRNAGGLRLGDAIIETARLDRLLKETPVAVTSYSRDWPLVKGNEGNSAQAAGSPPWLEMVVWSRPTVADMSDWSKEVERGNEADAWIKQAMSRTSSIDNTPVMSGTFPIVAGNLAVYRSHLDVRAVYLHEEKDADGTVLAKPGDIAWKSTDFDGALSTILADSKYRVVLDNGGIGNVGGNGWLNMYNAQGVINFVYENSLLGTVSSDRRLVYAIDDLAVPAPSAFLQQLVFNRIQHQQIQPLLLQNSLHAYDLKTGKFTWRIGDPFSKAADPFRDSCFLGAPLPVGGKLYVLNEKGANFAGDADLRLLCLDPRTGNVISEQNLGTVQQYSRFTYDMKRRTNAVHLAYGEGILVCPTNAGQVIGVDLMSRSLAWAYPYRERNPQPIAQPNQPFVNQPPSLPNWKSSPPVIVDGKVVFTAPDANSVHCINLRDGTLVWRSKQIDGDQFLAGVYKGKALIVGKSSCRALRLSDGVVLWNLPTGDLPSGQGVACKDIYYLPLGKGEICAIDIERGLIKARNRASKSRTVPGNLVFHEETGTVVSLTPNSIVAYPQLTVRLELANKSVADDPKDADKLITRGELRLADGQVAKAVEDLRTALAFNPPEPVKLRGKARLYDAYTDLFHVDFEKASTLYLNDYRELCSVSDKQEEQERLARFYRTVGQGREGQGDLVAAFQMYRQFGALEINQQGVTAHDDPTHKIPVSVWLRGRVGTMIASATPAQRVPLEQKIAEEWKQVRAKDDVNAIRSFVDMFDIPFEVGQEARLELARAIVDRKDRQSYLEAELNLQQLRVGKLRVDPRIGGRALAELARLEEYKGTSQAMKLAADYYDELKERFPAVEVRPGKTGADLYDQLASDKRFLPYLGGSGPLWMQANIAARELPAPGNRADFAGYVFQPRGDLNPLMRGQRLVLDPNNLTSPQLRLIDLSTNETRWTTNLSSAATNMQFIQYLFQQAQTNSVYHPNARYRFYEVKGHLAAFQLGTMVYCLDLDNPRILWQLNLLEGNNQPGVNLPPNTAIQQVVPDQEGNLQMVVWNQLTGARTSTRIGYPAAVQASYVALLTQKGLIVVDPLRGNRLWTKIDVPIGSDVFGDDQYIYIVSGGGAGAGQVLRASDGTAVKTVDFSTHYQNRVRIQNGNILAATRDANGVTLRCYDIVAGKDLWARNLKTGAVTLQSEDPEFTGAIEPDGHVVIVNTETGKDVLDSTVVQHRVAQADLKSLQNPLLLHDRDHFYIALNQEIDSAKVSGGIIANNFVNGLRCAVVNGWFVAFHKKDHQRKVGDETRDFKAGQMAWHTYSPMTNQMVVLEQFEKLPVVLFTSRYNELLQGGTSGSRWVSHTQSVSKRTGKVVWAGEPQAGNSQAGFYTFQIDAKAGTINMIGLNGTLQHYIDDGRQSPAVGGQPPAASTKTSSLAPSIREEVAVPVAVPVPLQIVQPVPRRLIEDR